ncbi:Nac domain-containing protein [Thalictrum thalictroides]|uniref:Nac domain-containing protein n=1 Tax=Thalictrum thalictroides TaxID=46969 RepID=A0A7J6V903_THATH|nr:Nac domain-containing protein [Thalictrum thalictroides]
MSRERAEQGCRTTRLLAYKTPEQIGTKHSVAQKLTWHHYIGWLAIDTFRVDNLFQAISRTLHASTAYADVSLRWLDTFSPTDEELISHYLKRKINGLEINGEAIAEVDICKFEPWDLPEKAIIQSDHEWFFFSPNGRKYPNGSQAKRATEVGFWKATGKERVVKSKKNVIGTKRTLVFHLGRAPKGSRTDWIMHEYCMKENKDDKAQDSYVICRLRKKQDFTSKNNNSSSDSVSNIGLSPESSSLPAASNVCGDLHNLEETGARGLRMDGTGKSAEDDCFADILKDDIVNLDANSEYQYFLLPKVAENSVAYKSTEPSMSNMDNIQGTANRRLSLERYGTRRKYVELPPVCEESSSQRVIAGDTNQSIEASRRENLFQIFSGWVLCTMFTLMVVLLLFLSSCA